MIDHDRKLLFIHIARTGGTSIEKALVGKDWWEIEPESKHLSASQARERYGDRVWRDYATFSVVRNPWDRVISMWATGWWAGRDYPPESLDPVELRDFILQLEPHTNERYDSLFYHEILNEELDFILRFERLSSDLTAMLDSIGIPLVTLPRVEFRARKPYRAYFDDELVALVETRFAADIQRFGYEF